MSTYYIFMRSARSFEEFAKAEKFTEDTGLTETEARQKCAEFNSNRSEQEIEAGTKLEYTAE